MPDSTSSVHDLTHFMTTAVVRKRWRPWEPDPHLRMAYERTVYVVATPKAPMVLKADQNNQAAATLLRARGLRSALFISAHNPWGACLSADDNRQRHAELLQALRPWPVLEGFRASPGGDWPAADSVLVLCDDTHLQLLWLQRFEQNAGVRVTDQGEVELVFNPLRPAQMPQATPQTVQTPFGQFPPHRRVCFYPSCGYALLWAVMQLDCDLFVFSDKDREFINWEKIKADFEHHHQPLELLIRSPGFLQFRSGRKIGVLLWEDNNLVLDRLRQADLKVHHFVGICDGCCEGGNYECVHERPFVQRLMQVATNGMRYLTDHSMPLQRFGPHSGWEMWDRRKFVNQLSLRDFPAPSNRGGYSPDPLPHVASKASFELLGVLIRPDDAPHHLTVLPKGSIEPTGLDVLKPFRMLAGRGILAEYRVNLHQDQRRLDVNLT
jgi:hypothetical protein